MTEWIDPCAKCEEMLQPYLDRDLDERERAEAQAHLDRCTYCRSRYRFEIHLRRLVRQCTGEAMPPALKKRLLSLRSTL